MQRIMMIKKSIGSMAGSALVLAGLMVGCGGGDAVVQADPPIIPPKIPVYVSKANAGVPLPIPAADSLAEYKKYAQMKNFGRRSSPFSLMNAEQKFEASQKSEKMVTDLGGFVTYVEEPSVVEEAEPPKFEQQPPRRLVGVLLGDGVSALIQMEDGRVYEIRPGTRLRVGANVWTVVSIDADRAVLRREGNNLPKEVTVVLGPSFIQSGGGNASGSGSGTSPTGRGAAGAGGSGGGNGPGAGAGRED